jgi:signal transduction protein with GAF and PtsI domain
MSQRLEQLALLTESLQQENELRKILEVLVDAISGVGFARCRLYTYEEDSNSFVGVAQRGLAPEQAGIFSGFTIKADVDSPITRPTTEPIVVEVEDHPDSLLSLLPKPTMRWIGLC